MATIGVMHVDEIMDMLEPITRENFRETRLEEWIWDNKYVYWSDSSYVHREQPNGFRKVLEISSWYHLDFPDSPWRLSSTHVCGGVLEYFEEGRFYRFKRKGETENVI